MAIWYEWTPKFLTSLDRSLQVSERPSVLMYSTLCRIRQPCKHPLLYEIEIKFYVYFIGFVLLSSVSVLLWTANADRNFLYC